jgi:rhomboid family GlyGly-CTERM serine protease
MFPKSEDGGAMKTNLWSVTAPLFAVPITVLIAATASLLQLQVDLQSSVELRFAELQAAGIWRLATCHLLHWSHDHFLWDVLVLVAAGCVCESRWPRRFGVVLAAAGVLIPAVVLISAPEVLSYRGLSGLDSALFALAAGSLFVEEAAAGRRAAAMVAGAAVAGQFLKIAVETAAGQTLFVQDAPFIPVPLAHLCGALIGSLVALWR